MITNLTRATRSSHAGLILGAALLGGLLSLASPAQAEEFTENVSISGDHLMVLNLIGEVRIESHKGSNYEIEVHVQGEDANREDVQIETRDGNDAELVVKFPIGERNRFVYPRLGRGSRTEFSIDRHWGDHGWLDKLLSSLGARSIRVEGRGSGLEMWADLLIKVPEGKELVMELGVGRIDAMGLNGKSALHTSSGSVRVDTAEGDLLVDTGSGHVEVADVRGDLDIDTGSGHVEARNIEGDRVRIDTGSGHVEIRGVVCSELSIDTGSGHVEAERVSADDVSIDTGSGGVELQLDHMGDGLFVIDTGSGGIELVLPEDAAADIEAETSSGGIHLDVLDADIRHRERDEIALRIGGGGGADVRLDTGSGGIRIYQ